jgi:hypothetical protein
MMTFGLLVFGLIWLICAFGFIRALWRNEPLIYVQPPQEVWRHVRREDRAAYVQMMRRTMLVQGRDLNRAIAKARRAATLAVPKVFR